MTRVTDANGHVTAYRHDAAGRQVRSTVAVGTADEAVTKLQYDALGQLTAVVDANHANAALPEVDLLSETAAARYDYDELGRRIRVTDADDTRRRVRYDPAGNPVETVLRDGAVVARVYDALDRLDTVTVGGVLQQTFAYDALSRLVKAVDHNEGRQTHAVELQHDFADRTVQRSRRGIH